MTNKPRLTAAQTAEITKLANELAERIIDFSNDMASDAAAAAYPDYIDRLNGELGQQGEMELLDCEDDASEAIRSMILATIKTIA